MVERTTVRAIIFNTGQHILLGQRSNDCKWLVVGGTPEQGELLEETAQREVREEVGLHVDLYFYRNTQDIKGNVMRNIFWFLATCDQDPKPDGTEILQARYVSPKDFSQYEFAFYHHLHVLQDFFLSLRNV